MTVELYSRRFDAEGAAAERVPFVVLHGLFGSSRNWSGVARKLARHRPVIAYDLRNHGRSPWQAPHDYESMARDVVSALDREALEQVVLMGHSMGGKAGMRVACDAPERVMRLYVLDIAPVAYPVDSTYLDALRALDLSSFASRADAERALAPSVSDRATRLFLLTNLIRAEDGGFRWQIPLEILHDSREAIFENPLRAQDRYAGPVRFVSGARSGYVAPDTLERARTHFPRADLVVLDDVGHDVHTEGGERFLTAVESPEA